jgi:hypothetical protein
VLTSTRILQLVEPIVANSDDSISAENLQPSNTDASGRSSDLPDEGLLPLRFRERSLRAFFRSSIHAEKGLKTPHTIAHSEIFTTCSRILCGTPSQPSNRVSEGLRRYAANFWLAHFNEFGYDGLSEDQSVSTIEGLAAIMSNENNISLTFETIGVDYTALLKDLDGNMVEKRIIAWASLGVSFGEEKLSSTAFTWAEQVAQETEPQKMWLPLIKAHVKNWYAASDSDGAKISFRFARSAMLMVSKVLLVRISLTNTSSFGRTTIKRT